MNRAGDLFPTENAAAVMAVHGPCNAAREGSHRRHFKVENVTALFDHNFLPWPRVQLDRDLISHRAAGHEQGGFLFEYLGRAFLQ